MILFIKKIKNLIDKKFKKSLIFLIFFSITVSTIEVVGISAIMPFIDIATNFSKIQENSYYKYVFDIFSFEKEVNFAIVFGFVMFVFYIFRGVINFVYHYQMARFSQMLYAQITQKLFRVYLKMPYQVFVNKNSSFLTKAIVTEATLLSVTVSAVLLMISEVFVMVFLYVLMLFAHWKITLIFTAIVLLQILFLIEIISKKIKLVGKKRAVYQGKFYEILNRTFGNFKHIKLQNKVLRSGLEDEFNQSVNEYANVNIINNALSVIPRLLLETVGFGLIVLVLVFLLYEGQKNVFYILPTLSLFVLALYRLLPSINRIVSSYNIVTYHHKSIDIVDKESRIIQENLNNELIVFKQDINLINVSFGFGKTSILSNINLVINKGEKIAFIGKSGAGKSTLTDLIIGLYQPKEGEILIDGILLNQTNLQNWRSKIGYIPQQVYLFDGTVADNVCFGGKLDEKRLVQVLKQANIFAFLESKQGIHTLVGEDGIQLSGGQKQRIAIARALYGNPEILVLDEATSALDDKTEQSIMNEIYQLCEDKTLIIIAHRLGTIKGCDKIYKLQNGVINA
ncbi:ABC transporter ATP-binding protein [Candidatus Pseudothioglobus singularis]|nr:ABC transporter ATP-binding protein [Candidatus Pseudothioglobus singularis]